MLDSLVDTVWKLGIIFAILVCIWLGIDLKSFEDGKRECTFEAVKAEPVSESFSKDPKYLGRFFHSCLVSKGFLMSDEYGLADVCWTAYPERECFKGPLRNWWVRNFGPSGKRLNENEKSMGFWQLLLHN